MKTLKIFLASSSELNYERKEISSLIRKENDILVKKNIYLQLVTWKELLQSFQSERIQKSFNEEILKCEIVIVLFYKKVGKFTKEEFEIAYKNLKCGKNPKYLFVFFKDAKIPINEMSEEILEVNKLKKQIENYEQIFSTFKNKDSLLTKIKNQLNIIINDIQKNNGNNLGLIKSNHLNINEEKFFNEGKKLDVNNQTISLTNILMQRDDLFSVLALGIIAKYGIFIRKNNNANEPAFRELDEILFHTPEKTTEIKDTPFFKFFNQEDLLSILKQHENKVMKLQSYVEICEIFLKHLLIDKESSFNIESKYRENLDKKQISDSLWKILEKNGSMLFKEVFWLDSKYQSGLDMQQISNEMILEFENNGFKLNNHANVLIIKKNESWLIRCKTGGYKIETDDNELLVHISNDSVSSIDKSHGEWIISFSSTSEKKKEKKRKVSFLVKDWPNELFVYKHTAPYYRTNEAIKYLYNNKDIFFHIIKELQISKIWAALKKIGLSDAKNWDELFLESIETYCSKLENRCLSLELLGIRGASNVDVQLTDIFVTLSFFENVPPGGMARIYSENPHDKRVLKYLQAYKNKKIGAISVEDVFKQPNSKALLILGMPGAGKSTLLKYQSLQYLKSWKKRSQMETEKKFIPIFIQLREFTKYEGYMSERICDYIQDQFGEKLIRDIVEVYFDCGLIAVFFDGLDEIADTAQRNKMASDIDTFSKDYPHILNVITCRIAAYSELTVNMSKFAKLTIDDMNENQRSEFIHKWYKTREEHWESEDVEKLSSNLISKIEKTRSIRRLAVNPLMLTIMAIIYSDLRDLPETRLELYEECVSVLIHRRDKARGLLEIQKFEAMMPKTEFILGELAYSLHEESESRGGDMIEPLREEINFRITDIIIRRRKVEDFCKRDAIESREVPALCKFIEERTSILANRGMGRYGFAHLTFQEYFAAYYLNTIKNIDELWDEINDKLNKPFWREVFLLLSEMLSRGQDVLDAILGKYIKNNEPDKSISQLLLFSDFIIQGTPVTDYFKSGVVRKLYQESQLSINAKKCLLKLKDLKDSGLGYEIYKIVEDELLMKTQINRLQAIHFIIHNSDLFIDYKDLIKEALKGYKQKGYKCEQIIPLMCKLDIIIPDIFCEADLSWFTSPFDNPQFFLYYRSILSDYSNSTKDDSLFKKLSAASFIYSSSLFHAIITISRGRGTESSLMKILNKVDYLIFQPISIDRIDIKIMRSRAIEVAKRLGISRSKAATYKDIYEVSTEKDLNVRIKLRRDCNEDLIISNFKKYIREPLFQATMIHLSAIFELINNNNKRLPSLFDLAINSIGNYESPFVKTSFILYNLTRKNLSPEQKIEFSRINNSEKNYVFDLLRMAYEKYNIGI